MANKRQKQNSRSKDMQTQWGYIIKKQGYTEREVARLLYSHPRTINNYVRGVREWPSKLREPLARLLGYSVEELFPPPALSPQPSSAHVDLCGDITLSGDTTLTVQESRSLLILPTYMVQLEGRSLVGVSEVPNLPFLGEGEDITTWLAERVEGMRTLAYEWPIGASYQQLNAHVQAELESWNLATMTDNFQASRRMALATLAMISGMLLKKVAIGPLSPSLLGDFFGQVTVSITACQQLLKGDGFGTIGKVLPTYLPILEELAKQPAPYQAAAARLAAQGSSLLATVLLNRGKIQQADAHYRNAVLYASLSNDPALHVATIKYLGSRMIEEENGEAAYAIYQQALPLIRDHADLIPPRLQGLIFVGIGTSQMYKTHKQESDALGAIDRAKQLFVDHRYQPLDLGIGPTSTGDHLVFQSEALGYMVCGDYLAAKKAFAQVDGVDPSMFSERVRLEVINNRAKLSLRMGDLDTFKQLTITGLTDAKVIGSEKRIQEVRSNWCEAQNLYPREPVVAELAERIIKH